MSAALTSRHRRPVARSLVASLLCIALSPGQAPLATAQEPASATYLSTEEGIQFAVKWAKFGQNPDASVMVDTAIGVMSVGFPAAGAALAVAWGFIKAMSAGPDPVFEALQALNARLDAHERFIVGLQNDLNAFRNQVFEKWDTDRLAALHRNLREVKSRTIELRMRPTDPVMKRRLVEDAKNLAAEFLPLQEGVLPEVWKWSDIPIHIEKGRVTPGNRLPPEFKVLPTFDYYVNALVLLMAAIEYESGGNAPYVRKVYAADLLGHARFLSVRPLWRELDPPETLPEHVMARVSCYIQPVSLYARDRICRASYLCQDLMRRTAAWVDTIEYRVDSDRQLCTYSPPPARPPSEQEQARRAEELDRNPRYGSSAMDLWRQWGQWAAPRQYGQEDVIEDAYGVEAMTALADKLVRLVALGTIKEPQVGQFDFTFYKKNHLYALKPNGELLWYSHLAGIDRNPPKIPEGAKLTGPAPRGGEGPGGLTRQSQEAATPSIAARPGRFADAPGPAGRMGGATKGEPATPSGDAAGQASPLGAGARAREGVHLPQPRPGPRITHQWEGPRLVATGWQGFREVIPAGSSGFYGLTSEGTLKWFRHDGALDGTGQWKGPVDVGRGGAIDPRIMSVGPRGISGGASGGGWNSCRKIVAAGDGVLYCLGADGTLRWYRHRDAADARARPIWDGPSVVGTGWGSFAHVFSAGEGTLYAVTPTGDLLWHRHRGYQTGENIWEGPKPVHTGWVNLKRIFSPGAGVIYALRADGGLLWWEHEGYRDGKPAWLGPVQVASGWDVFVQVFPRMTAPIVPR
jgi:hypothetical protein